MFEATTKYFLGGLEYPKKTGLVPRDLVSASFLVPDLDLCGFLFDHFHWELKMHTDYDAVLLMVQKSGEKTTWDV